MFLLSKSLGYICSEGGHSRYWESPEDVLNEAGAIRESFLEEVTPQLTLMLKTITIIIINMH